MNSSLFQPIRQFRQKLKAGRFCVGAGISLSDPVVTESLGPLFDFFWIDLEHTPMSLESLQAHLISCRAVGVPAMVRVPGAEPWFIKRVVDTGAGGIIVPQVRSAEEVKAVVGACRYQPQGNRGYGPRRASNYGYDDGYLTHVNQDLFVTVQIENVESFSHLDDIVQVEGLDSIAIGPFDLAASMGFMRQPDRPEVEAAIKIIIQAARKQGLWVGMGGPADEAYAVRAVQLGVQWLQSGGDYEYMSQFASAYVGRLLNRLGQQQAEPQVDRRGY
jgi:2-keto-3-deoxy-L-rhamnonate aldolase RhmA